MFNFKFNNMKPLKIVLGLILMMAVIAVYAEPSLDVVGAVNYAQAQIASGIDINTTMMAGLPIAIASSTIDENIINDLKLKFGHIKMITVVVEPAIYDIDNIAPRDWLRLQELGLDMSILSNTKLGIKERLAELEKHMYKDGSSGVLAAELYDLYNGKVISAGEEYRFLVRRPDRGMIKMLMPLATDGKIDEFSDKAVKNLVVGGDMSALEDGLVYMGVITQLKDMISPAQSFLSKA